jgi:hypothetical protein
MTDTDQLAREIVDLALDFYGRTPEGAALAESELARIFPAPPECDICPEPATVTRPATRGREEAHYCAADAKRYLGWRDTFHED